MGSKQDMGLSGVFLSGMSLIVCRENKNLLDKDLGITQN